MAAAKSLTQIEIDKVMQFVETSLYAKRNKLMLQFSLLAGMRVSEIADLKLCDVRDADGTVRSEIYLAAERVKHHHARTVYISTKLQADIADYLQSRNWFAEDQPLFTTHRGPRCGFSANTLTQHFFWMYRHAGIKGASSHSGRKTFLTSLASKGISVFVLASLAGHRSISTTQRYISVNDDLKRRAVELV